MTACTCSIRSRAARSASKRRACSIASAARSADELEQLDLVLVEARGSERADVEDAAHLSLDDERDAEHRLDPLLAQERVEDVRVVDVVEDRPAASRRRSDPRSRRRPGCGRPARPLPRFRARRARRARPSPRRAGGSRRCRPRGSAGCGRAVRASSVVEAQVCERGVGDGLQPPHVLGGGRLGPHRPRYFRKSGKAKRLRGAARSGGRAPPPRAPGRPRPPRARRSIGSVRYGPSLDGACRASGSRQSAAAVTSAPAIARRVRHCWPNQPNSGPVTMPPTRTAALADEEPAHGCDRAGARARPG